MTLTDFLLARIAEDESVGLAASTDTHGSERWSCEPWLCDEQGSHVSIDPPRMRAECQTKRLLIQDHEWDSPDGSRDPAARTSRVLRLLALPYADHPDYREEWKP